MSLSPEIPTSTQMLFAAMWRRLSQLYLVACLAAPTFAQQPAVLAPPMVSETVSVGYVMIPFTLTC